MAMMQSNNLGMIVSDYRATAAADVFGLAKMSGEDEAGLLAQMRIFGTMSNR